MVKWLENNLPQTDCSEHLSLMSFSAVDKIRRFYRSFPQYDITPLCELKNLAAKTGIGGIYIKDESKRFGLNSFKALGCTFALASYIAQKLGKPVWDFNYVNLPEAALKLGDFTFFAATDGNHGRAVAWAARELAQKAVIYMNAGSSQARLNHIISEGAEASISELNYDDTIRFVKDLAEQTPNSVIVQDTAWEGYTDIPQWIMQGYAVMALEAYEQLVKKNIKPTHVILQAGVGAFAGSAQAVISNMYGDKAPVTIIVEPHVAGCYYRSAAKGDGTRAFIDGDMKTIMAGLACGVPNPVSWEIIKNKARYFATIDDRHTEEAMKTLANPLGNDPKIISGESGAAGMGFLLQLLQSSELNELRDKAGIDENSQILVFSTEGDTDEESYLKIIEN